MILSFALSRPLALRVFNLVTALFALGVSSAIAADQTSFFGVPISGASSAGESSSSVPAPSTPEVPGSLPAATNSPAPSVRPPGTFPANEFYKMVFTNGEIDVLGVRTCLCRFESVSPTVDPNGTLALVIRTQKDRVNNVGHANIRDPADPRRIFGRFNGVTAYKLKRIPLTIPPALSVEIEIFNHHNAAEVKLNEFSKKIPEVYLEITKSEKQEAGGVLSMADWQKKTVSEFPTLMDPKSELNRRFTEKIRVIKASNPGYFTNPEWPYLLAKEVSGGMTSAPQIPGVEAAMGGNATANVPVAAVGKAALVQQATKEKPFINSLGMKFVPVPGTNVLFCVWETREQDYDAFCSATGVNRLQQKEQKADENLAASPKAPNMPVALVRHQEAEAFCRWLSQKEGMRYRLPTNVEWSSAAGSTKYPWGDNIPPPTIKANIAGEEAKSANWPKNRAYVFYQRDSFAKASPVGSFPPNNFGIFDLGGNVWERTQDREGDHRGGSWADLIVPSSTVVNNNGALVNIGFRCVVELPTNK